jgi:hypothetical protein
LLPLESKSVGKVCAVPARCTKTRLAAGTPLFAYCVCSPSIGFGPTVESLLPTNMKTFWFATSALLSLAVPLQLLMSACIVLSMPAEIVALYMHAV